MRFLLALILATCAISATASDHIVVLFDTSGSMGEFMRVARKTRMVVAKDALTQAITEVSGDIKVGLLTFDGWVYDLGDINPDDLSKAIQDCEPSGGTPLYKHMRMAGIRLLEERQAHNNIGNYKLLVLTDGEAQDESLNEESEFADGSLKLGVLDDIQRRGIAVDVIALDMGGPHSLHSKINGKYAEGSDEKSLKDSLSESLKFRRFSAEVGDKHDFKLTKELPKELIIASTTALSDFQNHKIGEKPPIKVVSDEGLVIEKPNSTDEAKDIGFVDFMLGLVCIVGFVAGVILVLIFIIENM